MELMDEVITKRHPNDFSTALFLSERDARTVDWHLRSATELWNLMANGTRLEVNDYILAESSPVADARFVDAFAAKVESLVSAMQLEAPPDGAAVFTPDAATQVDGRVLPRLRQQNVLRLPPEVRFERILDFINAVLKYKRLEHASPSENRFKLPDTKRELSWQCVQFPPGFYEIVIPNKKEESKVFFHGQRPFHLTVPGISEIVRTFFKKQATRSPGIDATLAYAEDNRRLLQVTPEMAALMKVSLSRRALRNLPKKKVSDMTPADFQYRISIRGV